MYVGEKVVTKLVKNVKNGRLLFLSHSNTPEAQVQFDDFLLKNM